MSKRIFDILIACIGLVICAPLFLVIAILIKVTSPGPVFFRQTRIGKNFRQFPIYKFRTMVWNVSDKGASITVGDDQRITSVGQWLRQYKLDELPQLINVLRGEMSLVGPRPEVPQYVEKFKDRYEGILTVLPGITDLASLRYINESSLLGQCEKPEDEYIEKILPEKMRLAAVYVQHSGVVLDMLIITQTVFKLMNVQVVLIRLPGLQSDSQVSEPDSASSFADKVMQYRRFIVVTLDLGLVVLANYLAFWLRFDGVIPQQDWEIFLQMLPWLIVIRGVGFSAFRLNEGLWRYVSLWDLRKIFLGVVASSVAFYAVARWGVVVSGYPRSIYIIDTILLVGFLIGIRLPFRLFREAGFARDKKKILIIGAGDTGEGIARQMKRDPSHDCEPIGFVDDDPSMAGQRIHGIKVLGTLKDLPHIIKTHQPHEILVAMRGTNPAIIREILTSLESFNIPIKRLPKLKDFMDGKITISQIRNLAIEDLLSRPQVEAVPQAVRHLIEGKRVLVTGAGGSIGSELCRQIAGFRPHELVLYERYENGLYAIAGELSDLGYDSCVRPVIGDVTDVPRLYSTMEKYRPDIVFHAAAHKHVPLMELNPGEAIKNNIIGTQTIAEAADHFEVEQFVLISTDKAVNPYNVMGATKRGAELIVQNIARKSKTSFHTVRFGNVLGSNGSVVPRFQAQIKAGGPVTVTHPDVRRYFMLIPEAVHLVLQAAAMGEQGGLYVLDMGEQVKLVDMARNLIQLSGFVPEKDIAIEYIGLRDGEKLEEELIGKDETATTSSVDKVLRIRSHVQPDAELLERKLKEFREAGALDNPISAIEQLGRFVAVGQKAHPSVKLVVSTSSEAMAVVPRSHLDSQNEHPQVKSSVGSWEK